MSAHVGTSWEELRKQARQLENDIDMKLVAFSKLGMSTGSSNLSAESVPLINSEDMFDTMSMELQQLLNKLSSINDKMADLAPSGAATMHTIKRHREILMDYQQEFTKTSARGSARREREELLRSSSSAPAPGLSRRDQYSKEANHLHSGPTETSSKGNREGSAGWGAGGTRHKLHTSRFLVAWDKSTRRIQAAARRQALPNFKGQGLLSHILVDEQINIAMEAREHLSSQRHTFKRMQTRFNDITNRFPMLNSLIYRINARKRRDSLIVGIVVAVCTFLLLLYAFH